MRARRALSLSGGSAMKTSHTLLTLLAAGVLAGARLTLAHAGAPVAIETVPVGNLGNAGEQSRIQNSDPTFYGSVAYAYRIGTHEVTAGQYTAFLNAVAASDLYNLYHLRMDYDADPTRNGCNIRREGVSGSYTYSVAPDWANRPVNYVSWGDAARFVNWLHNGQPTGAQDTTTTERGSYALNGKTSDSQLENVFREHDATWVIPTDSEWYKAAYHKNDGATANYWNLPTSAENGASHLLIDPDPGNHATFSVSQVRTIGAPYYRTEAGAHENSASPYGTFDQGGNVMEFTETVPENDIRRIRGGSWFWGGTTMAAYEIDDVMHSSDQFNDLGFRVASLVPEPVSVPPPGAGTNLRFRIRGPHPIRDEARFLVELPESGRVRIDVFDITGRRTPGRIDETLPAGANEVAWSAAGQPPGVYLARLSAVGRTAVLRFVRVR
jgi:formylglycine-generating enzyme required for sulfatase activity